ncbi:MAG TPA: creatininase family protein [Terriglobales bacterium]|nr:creatininase family protein [Terriglobales bacterium]
MDKITRRQVLRTSAIAPALATGMGLDAWGSEEGKRPVRLEEVIGFETAEAVASHPLAILPLGSVEFHGPHNPLGADSIIISGIAERVAARTNGLLLPTICFTQCPAHTAAFRGTMSIRPEVMTMYFADILRNVLQFGFKRIFVLNGHDGNIGPGRGAIAEVAHEVGDAAILFASWWEFLPGEMMKSLALFHQANGGHGHGGPLETSAVAAFRPDLIHLDKARDLPEPPDLSGGPPYFLQKSRAENWPGYSGKISEASAEKGRRLVGISEDGIVKLVENWLKNPDAPGSW